MAVMMLTEKECAIMACARMILFDQCPPDRKHYLCMVSEDCTGACAQCWIDYLGGIGTVEITLPKTGKRVRA